MEVKAILLGVTRPKLVICIFSEPAYFKLVSHCAWWQVSRSPQVRLSSIWQCVCMSKSCSGAGHRLPKAACRRWWSLEETSPRERVQVDVAVFPGFLQSIMEHMEWL